LNEREGKFAITQVVLFGKSGENQVFPLFLKIYLKNFGKLN